MTKQLTDEAAQIIHKNLALAEKKDLPIFDWIIEQESLKSEFIRLGYTKDEFYYYSQLFNKR